MDIFNFEVKTKLFFGKDREIEVGNIIASYGFKKIAIRKNYYQGTDGILMERKMM
jgi:ribosomal protein S18 acetylase RimI-like enzyme